jgi:hypothetical protein
MLLKSDRNLIPVRFAKAAGIEPDILVWVKYKAFRLTKLEISLGMGPVNWFAERSA